MNKKHFNYFGNKTKFLLLPIIIIVLGVVMYFVHGGFNFDVEFLGGTRMQLNIGQDFENNDIADIVKEATGLDTTVQKTGASQQEAIIKLPATDSSDTDQENQQKVVSAVCEKYGVSPSDALVSSQTASASYGKQVQSKTLLFTALAILCILIYIIIRFDLKSGVMAVVALIINVLVMAAVYAITNIAVNTTFIAAMLTVVGYSINNTIVIFDRIRENQKARKRAESIPDMANRSIDETLGRTINSTITTLITVVLIYILGVTSIKQFALPLIVGIVIGAYTSIFTASTYWAAWKQAEAEAKAAAATERRSSKKK